MDPETTEILEEGAPAEAAEVDASVAPEEGNEQAPAAPADPFAAYGGQQAVEQAIALHRSTQTKDGVMRLMFEAGRALGLSYGQVEQLFNPPPAAPAAPAAPEPDDDDVITWAQAKQLIGREAVAPVQQLQQQLAQQQQAAAEAQARATVAAVRAELGVQDEATWNAILQLGDRHLGEDLSPAAVRAAVQKGHADFTNLVKANAQAYVKDKAATKASVPKAPSGGTMPAEAPADEPKTVEEAIKRARARMAAAG